MSNSTFSPPDNLTSPATATAFATMTFEFSTAIVGADRATASTS